MSIRSRAWVVAALWLIAPSQLAQIGPAGVTSAWARPKPKVSEAERFAEMARKRFQTRDFEAAARLYMDAYARAPSPELVFNAARAYEEAGKRGDAAGLFKLYLSIATDPAGIADAQSRLSRLEEQSPPPGEAPMPGATPASQTGPEPAPAAAPEQAVSSTTAAPATESHAPAIAAGTAAVAVGAGVALMLLGRAEAANANELRIGSDEHVARYNDQFDRAEIMWWTGMGLTAAGTALAVWSGWELLTPRAASQEATIEIAPGFHSLAARIRF